MKLKNIFKKKPEKNDKKYYTKPFVKTESWHLVLITSKNSDFSSFILTLDTINKAYEKNNIFGNDLSSFIESQFFKFIYTASQIDYMVENIKKGFPILILGFICDITFNNFTITSLIEGMNRFKHKDALFKMLTTNLSFIKLIIEHKDTIICSPPLYEEILNAIIEDKNYDYIELLITNKMTLNEFSNFYNNIRINDDSILLKYFNIIKSNDINLTNFNKNLITFSINNLMSFSLFSLILSRIKDDENEIGMIFASLINLWLYKKDENLISVILNNYSNNELMELIELENIEGDYLFNKIPINLI